MLANFVRSSPIEAEEQARKAGEFDQVALKVSEGRPDNKPIVPPPVKSKPLRRSGGSRTARLLFRKLATVGIAAVAVAAALVTWDQYNAGPWTRDGRVRVQVASVAPEMISTLRCAPTRRSCSKGWRTAT